MQAQRAACVIGVSFFRISELPADFSVDVFFAGEKLNETKRHEVVVVALRFELANGCANQNLPVLFISVAAINSDDVET